LALRYTTVNAYGDGFSRWTASSRFLRLGPAAVGYEAHRLLNGDELVGRDVFEALVQAVRPVHIDVGESVVSQTEVQTRIVRREEARLAQHGLCLGLASVMDQHPSTNGAAIGFYALQFHLDPIGLTAKVIAQERGRFIEIDDEYVDIAVIVEVSEGTSPATVCCRDARTCLLDELFENPAAQIPKDNARCFEGVLCQGSFDLRVNVAGNHEDVWKTVVVEVDDADAPAHVTCFHPIREAPVASSKFALPSLR